MWDMLQKGVCSFNLKYNTWGPEETDWDDRPIKLNKNKNSNN